MAGPNCGVARSFAVKTLVDERYLAHSSSDRNT
jgi:hypothetical protein